MQACSSSFSSVSPASSPSLSASFLSFYMSPPFLIFDTLSLIFLENFPLLSFHFIFPFLIIFLILFHLIFLHVHGSNNPLGPVGSYDKIFFFCFFSSSSAFATSSLFNAYSSTYFPYFSLTATCLPILLIISLFSFFPWSRFFLIFPLILKFLLNLLPRFVYFLCLLFSNFALIIILFFL